MNCADCNGTIGEDEGPPDGWQLDDGRTVCHACCVADTAKALAIIQATCKRLKEQEEGATDGKSDN